MVLAFTCDQSAMVIVHHCITGMVISGHCGTNLLYGDTCCDKEQMDQLTMI